MSIQKIDESKHPEIKLLILESLDAFCKNNISKAFLHKASSIPNINLTVFNSDIDQIEGFIYFYQKDDTITIELMCSKKSGAGTSLINFIKDNYKFNFITCESSITAIDFYLKNGFYPIDVNKEYLAENDTIQATFFKNPPTGFTELVDVFKLLTRGFIRPLISILANKYKVLKQYDYKNLADKDKILNIKKSIKKYEANLENITIVYFPLLLANPTQKDKILNQIRSDNFTVVSFGQSKTRKASNHKSLTKHITKHYKPSKKHRSV